MRRSALGILSLVGLVGCGDGVDQKALDAVQKLVDGAGDEWCEYVYRCCDASEAKAVAAKRYTDKETCKAYLKLENLLTSYMYQYSVSRDAISVNTDAVDACLAKLKAQTCSTAYYKIQTPTECEAKTLFSGKRAAGETCVATYECVAGSHCVMPSGITEGICIPYRKQGEVCSSSSSSSVSACDETLVCANPKDAVRTCQPPAKVGEPCAEKACDTKNDPDLFCSYSPDANNPKCAKRKAAGEDCKSSSDCQTGLYCDMYSSPPSNKCTAPLDQGKACQYTSQCRADLYCDTYSSPPSNTCLARKDEGQACTSSSQCKSYYCDFSKQVCGAGTPPSSTVICDGK